MTLPFLVAVALALPARDAWTTGYVIDPPKEWGVGRGDPVRAGEPPPCASHLASQRTTHAVSVDGVGVVCATAPTRDDDGVPIGPHGLQLAGTGGWSRAIPEAEAVVQLVALPRQRVAVLSAANLVVVDARTGADVMPPLPLPAWPSWAAVDVDMDVKADVDGKGEAAETLLIRMGDDYAAIDVGGPTLDVLWFDGGGALDDRKDRPYAQKCGARWVDVAAIRHFRGDFAKTRAVIVLRVFDARRGLLGEKVVASEETFFDMVSFEFHCGHSGRLHMVGRWIILD